MSKVRVTAVLDDVVIEALVKNEVRSASFAPFELDRVRVVGVLALMAPVVPERAARATVKKAKRHKADFMLLIGRAAE